MAGKAATYYDVAESSINWISTAFFLAFVFVFPITVFVLNRSVKLALIIAAGLILIGNWIRYAGATGRDGGSIAHAMAGEIIIGFAQPFILAAPTRYSDLWFTNRGRVAATAVMSLANPLGAALGQLINPFWVSEPGDISDMVLYVSIIVSCDVSLSGKLSNWHDSPPSSPHQQSSCLPSPLRLLARPPTLLSSLFASHSVW